MRFRIISVLILSIAFAAFLTLTIGFGRIVYVDYSYEDSFPTDPVFIAAAAVLTLLVAAGLWSSDTQQRALPLLALPLAFVLAFGVGYGNTALAFQEASSRYDILTTDCYYINVLAYRGTTGVYILTDGKTAFHPLEKLRSMHPSKAAAQPATASLLRSLHRISGQSKSSLEITTSAAEAGAQSLS